MRFAKRRKDGGGSSARPTNRHGGIRFVKISSKSILHRHPVGCGGGVTEAASEDMIQDFDIDYIVYQQTITEHRDRQKLHLPPSSLSLIHISEPTRPY